MEPKQYSLVILYNTTSLLGDTTFLQPNGGGHECTSIQLGALLAS